MTEAASGVELLTRHEPALVVAALLVAVLASYVSLEMASLVQAGRRGQRAWWCAGSLVMGTGVWAMHFLGMLGFDAGMPIGYRWDRTLLSWLAACAAAGVALGIAARQRVGPVTLLLGSLSMAVGICTMHYLGMAAIEFAPGIRWRWPLVAASVGVAWITSAVALLIFMGLRRLSGPQRWRWQLAASVLMGAAIGGMHFTGMAAVTLTAGTVCLSAGGLTGPPLAVLVIVATGLLLGGALALAAQARRIERRRTLALLNSVLDASVENAIWAVDLDGLVTVFNRGAERLLGYRAAEVLGHPPPALLDPQELTARRRAALEDLADATDPAAWLYRPGQLDRSEEWTCRRADGSAVPISLVVHAMRDPTGELQGHLHVACDISQRRAQEQALRDAVRQAKAANQAKSQFLANMSHEIRTPLNAVIGLSHVLSQDALSPGQASTLGQLQLASHQLLDLINDVLDISRIEAGEMRLSPVAFDPARLVQELGAVMGAQARAKGLAWQVDCEGLPPALVGDALRLRQVLFNLLGNAVKFTERGQVTLQVRATPAGPGRVQLACLVEDSGCGISADALPRLFAPFVQADASTTRRHGGSGLGLFIVRQLVTLMQGELSVDSQPGQGSRFRISLPLPLGELPAAAPAGRTEQRDRQPLAGVRLLVVDDNGMNLEVASRLLGGQGARVAVAEHGQAALVHLHQHLDETDLVLMDLQMPVMDGCEATRLIRRLPGGAELPVIGLSAGLSAEETARALGAGMNELVGKPFDPPTLVGRICHWLPRRLPAAAHPLPATPAGDATATATPTWPAVEGLDMATAHRQLGGQQALLRELLARLLHRFADLAATAPQDSAARLHDLKGSAGTVGASAIAQGAAQAEAASRRGEPVQAQLAALQAQLSRLAAAVQAAGLLDPPAPKVPPAEDAAGATPLDPQRLQVLLTRLEQFDLSAGEAFDALAPALRQRLGGTACEALRQQVAGLDYAPVAQRLHALLKEQAPA